MSMHVLVNNSFYVSCVLPVLSGISFWPQKSSCHQQHQHEAIRKPHAYTNRCQVKIQAFVEENSICHTTVLFILYFPEGRESHVSFLFCFYLKKEKKAHKYPGSCCFSKSSWDKELFLYRMAELERIL